MPVGCFAGVVGAAGAGVCYAKRQNVLSCFPTGLLMSELRSRGVGMDAQTVQMMIDANYSREELLGAGATGSVYRVKQKASGLSFALKVLSRKKKNDAHEQACANEIRALKRLQHRNVMNLYETYESDTMRWLITEIVRGGQLLSYLEEVKYFSERSALHIIKQVLEAVAYMHSHGVVHRDLKLENIFVKERGASPLVKIGDFGAAAVFDAEVVLDKHCTLIKDPFCGTPLYMAPEVARKPAEYGSQCDLWSTGVLLHELVTGKAHLTLTGKFKLRDFFEALQSFELKMHSLDAADVSEDCKDLVKNLLQYEPHERFSAQEALNHRILTDERKRASTVHQSAVLSSLKGRASLLPLKRGDRKWTFDDHDLGKKGSVCRHSAISSDSSDSCDISRVASMVQRITNEAEDNRAEN